MSKKGGDNRNAPSKQGGTYIIRNEVTGRRYIGSTVQFGSRWSRHRNQLRKNEHHCLPLQRDWQRYGEASFTFEILQIINDPRLYWSAEQLEIDDDPKCYNVSRFASGSRVGLENRPEHRARISAALQSPESQAKLSARWKGKKQSDEHLAARAEAMRGNTNGKGKVISPEERAAMNAGLAKARAEGKVKKPEWTPEQRAKAAEHARRGHEARKAAKG